MDTEQFVTRKAYDTLRAKVHALETENAHLKKRMEAQEQMTTDVLARVEKLEANFDPEAETGSTREGWATWTALEDDKNTQMIGVAANGSLSATPTLSGQTQPAFLELTPRINPRPANPSTADSPGTEPAEATEKTSFLELTPYFHPETHTDSASPPQDTNTATGQPQQSQGGDGAGTRARQAPGAKEVTNPGGYQGKSGHASGGNYDERSESEVETATDGEGYDADESMQSE